MPDTKTSDLTADTTPVDPSLVVPAMAAGGSEDFKVVIGDWPVSTLQAAADAAAQAAAEATAAAALSSHSSDSTNVHGITDTSALESTTGAQAKADAKVAQTITNGVTTSAPSQDAVFDALGLKADDSAVVHGSLYDANTVLKADSDNTPAALTMGASTILARLAAGNIVAATPTQLRTLLNVEDGATADLSAAEILSLLLTVDGSGSGLDADLLDGNSSAAFATAAALTAHIDDTSDAHDASAISIADSGNDFTATDVEGALAELQSDHEADVTALSDHAADTTNIHGIADTSVLESTTGAQAKADAKVAQTITNGVTTSAPSQDAVFDALALKADLASPALTGNPTAPTQSAGNNSTRVATTAYADAKVADAINDSTTGVAPSQNAVFDALALKAPLASPTFTGTVVLPADQALTGNPTVPTQTQGNSSTRAASTAFVNAEIAADAANKTLDAVLASGATTVTDKTPNSTSYVQWGTEEATVAQADSPASVVVMAWLTGVLRAGPGTITALSDRGLAKLQVSYDGGSNFADLGPECNVTVLSTNTFRGASVATQGRGTGTVTGDVQVRAMCRDSEAANDCTFFGGYISLLVHPQ